MRRLDAPRGRGPYGITATPGGEVWYASLAGNHIARIDPANREATVVDPPTAGQGARRVWSDSSGRLWVSEWNAGQVGVHDPADGAWQEWPLPGDGAAGLRRLRRRPRRRVAHRLRRQRDRPLRPCDRDVRHRSAADADAAVRQLLGRPGEVWGAESASTASWSSGSGEGPGPGALLEQQDGHEDGDDREQLAPCRTRPIRAGSSRSGAGSPRRGSAPARSPACPGRARHPRHTLPRRLRAAPLSRRTCGCRLLRSVSARPAARITTPRSITTKA